MKYLKLFESTNHDYFKELEEKTGISHIKPEIDDLFLDLVDNIPNAKITDDLTINLTYKRKNIRKYKISYTYYYNALKSAHKLFANEITYLKDFLDKCELSIKLDMEYWKQISVSIDNIEDLQTFKQDLQDIKNRSQSLGYNFWINTSKNIDDEVTIDVLFNRESFENDFEEGSISKFNLYQALKNCQDLLVKFGGHSAAAGLTIEIDRIEEFRIRINHYADQVLEPEAMLPELDIDLELNSRDISFELVEKIEKFFS